MGPPGGWVYVKHAVFVVHWPFGVVASGVIRFTVVAPPAGGC